MDQSTLTTTLRELAADAALHSAPAADARRRAARLQRRRRTGAVGLAAVVALSAFGVRDLTAGATRHTTTATASAHVLTLQQVKYEKACDAQPMLVGELTSDNGRNCYILEPAALTLHPQTVQALYDSTQGYLVQVNLNDADRVAFGALTAKVVSLEVPENQLAIVLNGKVLSAPTIQAAIEGGTFQITAGADPAWTQAYAEQLAAQLRG